MDRILYSLSYSLDKTNTMIDHGSFSHFRSECLSEKEALRLEKEFDKDVKAKFKEHDGLIKEAMKGKKTILPYYCIVLDLVIVHISILIFCCGVFFMDIFSTQS